MKTDGLLEDDSLRNPGISAKLTKCQFQKLCVVCRYLCGGTTSCEGYYIHNCVYDKHFEEEHKDTLLFFIEMYEEVLGRVGDDHKYKLVLISKFNKYCRDHKALASHILAQGLRYNKEKEYPRAEFLRKLIKLRSVGSYVLRLCQKKKKISDVRNDLDDVSNVLNAIIQRFDEVLLDLTEGQELVEYKSMDSSGHVEVNKIVYNQLEVFLGNLESVKLLLDVYGHSNAVYIRKKCELFRNSHSDIRAGLVKKAKLLQEPVTAASEFARRVKKMRPFAFFVLARFLQKYSVDSLVDVRYIFVCLRNEVVDALDRAPLPVPGVPAVAVPDVPAAVPLAPQVPAAALADPLQIICNGEVAALDLITMSVTCGCRGCQKMLICPCNKNRNDITLPQFEKVHCGHKKWRETVFLAVNQDGGGVTNGGKLEEYLISKNIDYATIIKTRGKVVR